MRSSPSGSSLSTAGGSGEAPAITAGNWRRGALSYQDEEVDMEAPFWNGSRINKNQRKDRDFELGRPEQAT